jgi:hypothetical protein
MCRLSCRQTATPGAEDGLDHYSGERAHPRAAPQAGRSHRREQFFAELNAASARLKADPVAWEEELAERALWETTLADGLDDW